MIKISIDETLIIRFFSDEVTSEERKAVNSWLLESDENRRVAERIYYIMYAGNTVRVMRSINARAALRTTWKLIRKRSRHIQTMWFQRAAAVACLCLFSAIVYLQLRNNTHHNVLAAVEINVPHGSITSMTLPDGSKLWLNAGTQLSYDNGFGITNRRLTLVGEGFFDVKTNDRLPFEVEAGGVVVIARGTQFNVKAYPDDPTVTAILTEGLIEIITDDGQGQSKTISEPGKMVVHSRPNFQNVVIQPASDSISEDVKTASPSTQLAVQTITNPDVYTAWKERRWIVEGATLAELAPILERRYAVKFVFDSDALKSYKFRGEISNISVEQMARALQLTAPMNYRMSNDTVFFTIDLKRKQEFDRFVN